MEVLRDVCIVGLRSLHVWQSLSTRKIPVDFLLLLYININPFSSISKCIVDGSDRYSPFGKV